MSSFFSFGSRGRGNAAGSEDSGPARSPGGKAAGAAAADGSGKRGTGSPIERRDSTGGGSVKFPASQQAQGQSAGPQAQQQQQAFGQGVRQGQPIPNSPSSAGGRMQHQSQSGGFPASFKAGGSVARPALGAASAAAADEAQDPSQAMQQEWAARPSRERRFTIGTRPDLHPELNALREQEEGAGFGNPVLNEEQGREEEERQRWMEHLDGALNKMQDDIAMLEEREGEGDGEVASDEEDAEPGQMGDLRSRHSRASSSKGSARGRGKGKKVFTMSAKDEFWAYAYKKGVTRTGWKKRFFLFRPLAVRLDYYKCTVEDYEKHLRGDKKLEPQGAINLRGCQLLYGDAYERKDKRRNPNIKRDLEFAIEDKHQRRLFEMAALNEEDFVIFVSHIESIMAQERDFYMSNPVPGTSRGGGGSKSGRSGAGGNGRDEEEYDLDEATAKWDAAQNWRAFGRGLFEGRVGERCNFTVQVVDEFGKEDPRSEIAPGALSVVLESDGLHYDLPVVDNLDGTFTVSYEPAVRGEYELSVMLHHFDIYGSPFHPFIEAAPVSSKHCAAEGTGLLFAVVGQTNEFTVLARNMFGEPVAEGRVAPGDVQVKLSAPLVLETVEPLEGKGGAAFRVCYKVDPDQVDAEAIKRRAEGGEAAQQATIEVTVADPAGESYHPPRLVAGQFPFPLDLPQQIIGSPFSPAVAASLGPADVAAALAASEFGRLLKDGDGQGGPVNPFTLFSKLFRTGGLQLSGLMAQDQVTQQRQLGQEGAEERAALEDRSPASDGPDSDVDDDQKLVQQQLPQAAQRRASAAAVAATTTTTTTTTTTMQLQPQPPIGSVSVPYIPAPSYFPVLAAALQKTPGAEQPSQNEPRQPAHQQHIPQQQQQQQQQQQRKQQQQAGHWLPATDGEAALVRDSLEERARAIERERAELVRKRAELDESRSLIDEQVRRMQEIGQRVAYDSERVIEEARKVSQHSPLRATAPRKENAQTNGTRLESGPSPRKLAQASPSAAQGVANRVALDGQLVALFDRHAVVLSRVYEFYRFQNGANALQLSGLVRLMQDYDITPMFVSRKEIRDLYSSVAADTSSLSYEAFVELLASVAVHALSKPMFAHLYPSTKDQVNVLLTTWGVADAVKLSDIMERSMA
jgi:hypothetical protein